MKRGPPVFPSIEVKLSNTNLSDQLFVWGIKNRLFLDNILVDSGDIRDTDTCVALTTAAIVEIRI